MTTAVKAKSVTNSCMRWVLLSGFFFLVSFLKELWEEVEMICCPQLYHNFIKPETAPPCRIVHLVFFFLDLIFILLCFLNLFLFWRGLWQSHLHLSALLPVYLGWLVWEHSPAWIFGSSATLHSLFSFAKQWCSARFASSLHIQYSQGQTFLWKQMVLKALFYILHKRKENVLDLRRTWNRLAKWIVTTAVAPGDL